MIPKVRTEVDTNFAGFETQQFSVALTGKTFHTLFDTLYTNKTRAVVRELWTNAYDSHVEAGIADVPFYCRLPSYLEPTFAVRDYGTSLTHDQVMHLYTTVFMTTKDTSNKYVGQLGLGSKSPFAYTDSFTVTAWLDGYKRTYVASLGVDGIPTIVHINTEPSGEPRGLEVTFPVEHRHADEFKSEAQNVARGFDVPPTVVGVQIPVIEPEMADTNWKIYRNHQGYSDSIRQGCVLYPVTQAQLPFARPVGPDYSIVVDLPIGSVDVAANREALSFDDDTRAVVLGAFAAAGESVDAFISAKLGECANLLEAERQVVQWNKYIPNVYKRLTYRGRPLKGYIEFPKEQDPPVLLNRDGKVRQPRFTIHDIERVKFIIDHDNVKVLRKRRRIAQAMPKWSDHIILVKNPTKKQLEQMMRRLGLHRSQIIPVAQLPDVAPPQRRQFNGRLGIGSHSGVYEFDHHGYLTRPEEVTEDDYYWLRIDKGVTSASEHYPLIHRHFWIEIERMPGQFLKLVDKLDIEPRPVYLLTSNARKRFNVEQDDALDFVIAETLDVLKDEIILGYTIGKLQEQLPYGADKLMEYFVTPEEFEAYTSRYLRLNGTAVVAQKFLSEIKTAVEDRDIPAEIARLKKKFGLLFPDPDRQEVIDYISTRR